MERILIVEDEQGIRDTLKDVLELSGYHVMMACNGKQGYEKIMDAPPSLVLCDVNMPELGGFELLEMLNQRLKDELIPPFLFLTAKVEQEEMRYGMSLGADDYICKPFRLVELEVRILKWFNCFLTMDYNMGQKYLDYYSLKYSFSNNDFFIE